MSLNLHLEENSPLPRCSYLYDDPADGADIMLKFGTFIHEEITIFLPNPETARLQLAHALQQLDEAVAKRKESDEKGGES